MARWPLNPRPTMVVNQPRVTSRMFTTIVTGAATSHVKGAWLELIASTLSPSSFAQLWIANSVVSGSATDMLCDFAIGASGAEQEIVSNLLCGYLEARSSVAGALVLALPLSIPKASRVSVRIQGLIASDTLETGVELYGGSPWEGVPTVGHMNTYGVNTATSKGTVVTAGSPANAKGAWTDVVTSTARPHELLMMLFQTNSRVVTATEEWTADVGLWNGTSYDVIWPDVPFRYAASETISYQNGMPIAPIGFSIPRGSRLGVRASCTTASLTLDVALYGM